MYTYNTIKTNTYIMYTYKKRRKIHIIPPINTYIVDICNYVIVVGYMT